PDYTHANGVAYNAQLDQISVRVWDFSEFWIIDHRTTTAAAASHRGGRQGKGGDLLYRWGNPRAYRARAQTDPKLFSQHNPHSSLTACPREGHPPLFKNCTGRPGEASSSVEELILPVDSQRHYTYKPGSAYGPAQPVSIYTAPKKADVFSGF